MATKILSLLLVLLLCLIASGNAKSNQVEKLINDLKDKDPQVREKAARALGKATDSRAVEALSTALKDKDSSVRWNTAIALG